MTTPPPSIDNISSVMEATTIATATTTSTNDTKDIIWDDELENDYQTILSVGEECINPNELKSLLIRKGRRTTSNNDDSNSNRIILYDGFEPSGRMHIAQGIFKAMNVNKCVGDTSNDRNTTFVFWVADWFAYMNDKMGGDLNKIQIVGQYLIEVWKAAGMKLDNVIFKWASHEINHNANTYWTTLLDVTRRFTITRIKKCCQIMGRFENTLTSAQILYPLMQCTDIFFLKADICQLGVDQRKVNMLAREYCDYSKRKNKPIILSHHMLYGLKAGQAKMSKSDPDSAIFMEDSIEDVTRKINNAYCPRQEQETTATSTTMSETNKIIDEDDAGKASLQLIEDKLKNPCLDYIKCIIFSPPNASFVIKDDNNKIVQTYYDYISIHNDFLNGIISEKQLKDGLINEINELLEPVRQHFYNDIRAKELLSLVQQYKKETLIVQEEPIIRRCNLIQLQKIPSNCHLVFAPIPTVQPTIQMAIDTLERIRYGLFNQNDIKPTKCILYLQDWSAIVSNACLADTKTIAAYYTILLQCMKALDSKLMNEHVQIMYQSEAILYDPSNYWICVINAGRHFMLQDIMDYAGSLHDDDNVGLVIAQLMQFSDIASVEPISISLPTSSKQLSLIHRFYETKLKGMIIPKVSYISGESIRLQPIRELDALITENDEYYILDDPKVHGKSKMKKAFCEPGNISFCPPIAIASVFSLQQKGGMSSSLSSLEIQRSEANGGNVTYTNKEALQDDFAKGEIVLHPGDIKTAATNIMIRVLEIISQSIQSDKNVVAASKSLKAAAKKKK